MTSSTMHEPVTVRMPGLRGVPHAEVVTFVRDDQRHDWAGICYNTIGLPHPPSDDAFRALDADALKAEYGADAVWMNGPRRTLMDVATGDLLDGGRVVHVGGIPMRIVAVVRVPDPRAFAAKRPTYTDTVVDRTTNWLFEAGKPVSELLAPDGSTYVMQSLSRHIDPDLDVDGLPALGDRLQLPEGWRYRVRTLEEDLHVLATDGKAHVVLDEFEDNYQRAG